LAPGSGSEEGYAAFGGLPLNAMSALATSTVTASERRHACRRGNGNTLHGVVGTALSSAGMRLPPVALSIRNGAFASSSHGLQ
jgi:hypothetical protein